VVTVGFKVVGREPKIRSGFTLKFKVTSWFREWFKVTAWFNVVCGNFKVRSDFKVEFKAGRGCGDD